MLISPPVIALLGKVGHGKTLLINKLSGKRFPSRCGAKSVTRTLQWGYTKQHNIAVVDTPGFYGTEDVAAHIAAQKLALEGTPLSGIYLVTKFGRADDMAEALTNQINFVGSDDVRIVITHEDTVKHEEGYSSAEIRETLARRLDVPVENICIAGKDTEGNIIESFIHSTLHEPRSFNVHDHQIAAVSSLSVASRRVNKEIESVYAKIAAASKACSEWTRKEKSYESDIAITTIQHTTSEMVKDAKSEIFRRAFSLSEEEQNLIYGKAGFALSVRLQTFMAATNKLLSWDITDPTDPRNVYRKCNSCGAVYNKTEGCDGWTTCGAVPKKIWRARHGLSTGFAGLNTSWDVEYYWNGRQCTMSNALSHLEKLETRKLGGGQDHKERSGAVIESGCGASISWRSMLPVEPELIQKLGSIELQRAGATESSAKDSFQANIRKHATANRRIIQDMLSAQD